MSLMRFESKRPKYEGNSMQDFTLGDPSIDTIHFSYIYRFQGQGSLYDLNPGIAF